LIGFGRGRPVQIDPSYYKKPYRDELIVALAGPLTNVILGILAIIIMMVYMKTFALGLNALSTQTDLVIQFWITFAVTNFALAAFNMIPLPPLDGYRLIKVFNHNAGAFLEKTEAQSGAAAAIRPERVQHHDEKRADFTAAIAAARAGELACPVFWPRRNGCRNHG